MVHFFDADIAKKYGVNGWCLKLPAIHNAGLPDRLCLFPGGEVVFVELKAFGKKPRKIQTLMPVSYTHLDVYKRQAIPLSKYIELLNTIIKNHQARSAEHTSELQSQR